MKLLRPARYLVLVCVAAALAGCFRSTLRQIADDPAAYRNQVVTVTGEVTGHQKLPGVEWAFYQLSADGAGIWVMAEGEPPPIGIDHTVTGRVLTGITMRGASFSALIDATQPV